MQKPYIDRLDGARVAILGGTGSLGKRLFHRLMAGELGAPASVSVVSRDEAKQHYMRLDFLRVATATDDIIYREGLSRARFTIGDVRNPIDVKRTVDRADVIFHAAALKQVPTCEYHGRAAVDTNVTGAINLAIAVGEAKSPKSVVGISTDKACKPVNLMGMTKAIQERILLQANLDAGDSRLVNVRYGNVMASRGSAIPFFIDLVRRGEPIPITDREMTRFLMTIDESVDLIFQALRLANPGETFLPIVPAARIVDVAHAVAGSQEYPLADVGIRPGEKIHEVLVSEEEAPHTEKRGENLVILPILPELRRVTGEAEPFPFHREFTSASDNIPYEGVVELLERHSLTATTAPEQGSEIYR